MSVPAIVHVLNEDPILCEMEEMPDPQTQVLVLNNPRRRDGNELHYLEQDVSRMIIPMHRINYVQILPSGEAEDVIGFVRD